jgi:hypothetical protein
LQSKKYECGSKKNHSFVLANLGGCGICRCMLSSDSRNKSVGEGARSLGSDSGIAGAAAAEGALAAAESDNEPLGIAEASICSAENASCAWCLTMKGCRKTSSSEMRLAEFLTSS